MGCAICIDECRSQTPFRPVPLDGVAERAWKGERERDRTTGLHIGVVDANRANSNCSMTGSVTTSQRGKCGSSCDRRGHALSL